MEKHYSVKFFSSFLESLQNLCQEHLTFDQIVEVSGYVCVEIDNAKKERYVLSELLQHCGNVISESYCTKAYKNLPLSSRGKEKFSSSQKTKLDVVEDKEDRTRCEPTRDSDDEVIIALDAPPQPKRRKSQSTTIPKSARSSIAASNTGISQGKNMNKKEDSAKKCILGRVATLTEDYTQRDSCGIGIESRSSSFLESAAKLHSSSTPLSPDKEMFRNFVSNVVESLGSPSKSLPSGSSNENSYGGDDTQDSFTDLPLVPKKMSKSSSMKSSSVEAGQPVVDITSNLASALSPATLEPSLKLTGLFTKSKTSPKTSFKKSPKTSCDSSPTSLEQPERMNFSSLRHLISKSNEDQARLQHRTAGTETDIPPGEPYIELLDEAKEDEGESDGAAGLQTDHGNTGIQHSTGSDHTDPSYSGVEVPCTVSSSLMLEVGSSSAATSVEDVDSALSQLSDDTDNQEDNMDDNVDSPIIIDLDSEDEEDSVLGDDADPFSSTEIRKLDSFKDYVRFAVKRFQSFIKEKGVNDPMFRIPPDKLDPLLAEFYVTVRNLRGQEFGISTLKSIQSYLELYLRENGYPVSITRDTEFLNCRTLLQTKIQQLRQLQNDLMPNHGKTVSPLTRRDVEKLFRTGQLGSGSAESLTNSVWFMNSVMFKMNQNSSHASLKWGDIVIKVDEYKNEYLQLVSTNSSSWEGVNDKVYPNNANPDRCFVSLFMKYQRMRPPSMLAKKSPFYLTVDKEINCLTTEKMSFQTVSDILRSMLVRAFIKSDKKIVIYDII
ncbi:uncharacterized protein LOC124284554 [Haliotis rubra]|uniref:uncharacterized protein LOC124284554 n=1 Tax=Haliotis rubra TaxID=36100 RepID=UPI001EE539BD|nr:uncharacterized protein LOC124284554 [Haliotis rubra]XP_046576595.1 uncharacterized protein LOC124284554 [Haliotis rubra]XP_046576596.1 uncharacterized protein LOC124284554 [Haliotis rubra]